MRSLGVFEHRPLRLTDNLTGRRALLSQYITATSRRPVPTIPQSNVPTLLTVMAFFNQLSRCDTAVSISLPLIVSISLPLIVIFIALCSAGIFWAAREITATLQRTSDQLLFRLREAEGGEPSAPIAAPPEPSAPAAAASHRKTAKRSHAEQAEPVPASRREEESRRPRADGTRSRASLYLASVASNLGCEVPILGLDRATLRQLFEVYFDIFAEPCRRYWRRQRPRRE